jgi:hypothetical protein
METRELSKEEIISLIAEFKSEVRKNLSKIDFFNEKIEELTKMVGSMPTNVSNRKPYPLSTWDKIIIEVVKENGKPCTSKEIYDKAMAKARAMGIEMDELKMKSKINQCLVKLTNRRGDLKKVKYQGRGFAYMVQD